MLVVMVFFDVQKLPRFKIHDVNVEIILRSLRKQLSEDKNFSGYGKDGLFFCGTMQKLWTFVHIAGVWYAINTFVDVQHGPGRGLDIMWQVWWEVRIVILFQTDSFALDLYLCHALHYEHKPFHAFGRHSCHRLLSHFRQIHGKMSGHHGG